jgi:imidazoleglycerol phosphate synthase glutamine amidotransferase subunit HisH
MLLELQIHHWLNLDIDNEMLMKKQIMKSAETDIKQSISYVIIKQNPIHNFYPVPSSSKLHEIGWDNMNAKKFPPTWLNRFRNIKSDFYFIHSHTELNSQNI